MKRRLQHTFINLFPSGITARVTITLPSPHKPSPHSVFWSAKPGPLDLEAYETWKHIIATQMERLDGQPHRLVDDEPVTLVP
jgi:hypothetical protein